jgi:type I restriction enzyme S subunit
MHQLLGSIATVLTGYSFRSSLKELPKGEVIVIQAKDIDHQGKITEEGLQKIDRILSLPQTFLKPGDIVLTARGRFHAAIYLIDSPAIASSSVVIIRPDFNAVDGSYLSAYLNSSTGQTSLEKIAIGASVKALQISNLRQLEIPTPPIAKQKKISYLFQNILKQQELCSQKARIQTRIAESLLLPKYL